MYLVFVLQIIHCQTTVHQVSYHSLTQVAIAIMVRQNRIEATQVAAETNLRRGMSSADFSHGAMPVDAIGNNLLTRAYRRGCKSLDGSSCYQLGRFHECRAEAAALRVVKGDASGLVAPEVEWAEAIRNADTCFRNALRKGVAEAAASICKLHQIEPGQSRPIYPGDEVRIHGLVSSLGQRLNQRAGVAVTHMLSSGRCGVAIDDIGIKYIRFDNLTIICHYGDCVGPSVRGGCACDGCVQSDTC